MQFCILGSSLTISKWINKKKREKWFKKNLELLRLESRFKKFIKKIQFPTVFSIIVKIKNV